MINRRVAAGRSINDSFDAGDCDPDAGDDPSAAREQSAVGDLLRIHIFFFFHLKASLIKRCAVGRTGNRLTHASLTKLQVILTKSQCYIKQMIGVNASEGASSMIGDKQNRQTTELKTARQKILNRRELTKRDPTTEIAHKIIAAAVEEFAANGVGGARVAEICRRAGTTDPTFYRYFVGLRHAALFIISEFYWSPLNRRLNHYRQITEDPKKLFEAVVTSLICSAEDDANRPWLAESQVFKIVVAENRSPLLLPDSMLDDEYVGFLIKLEEIIKAGQRQSVFTVQLRPAIMASLLVGSLHGLIAQNMLRYQPFQIAENEMRVVAANLVGLQN